MYNGYIESQPQTDARTLRLFEYYKINFQLTHTTEADADAVANMVDTAEASEIESSGADVQDAVNWQDETSKTINLNGYKATATASWRERHLNES